MQDAFSTSALDEIWKRLTRQDAEVVSPAASHQGMDQAITFDQFLKALRGVGKPSREQLAQRRLSRPQRLLVHQRTTSDSMFNRVSTDSSASCSSGSTSGISGIINLPGIRSRAASPDSMARSSSTRRRGAGPVSPAVSVSVSCVSSSATLPILSRRVTSDQELTASKNARPPPPLLKDFGSGSDLGHVTSASTTASSQASPQTGSVGEIGQSPSSCKWGQSPSYQSIPEGAETELRRSVQANCLSCAGLGCGLCRSPGCSPATARTDTTSRAYFMRSFQKIRGLSALRATPRKVHPQDTPRAEPPNASKGRTMKLPLLGKSLTFGGNS